MLYYGTDERADASEESMPFENFTDSGKVARRLKPRVLRTEQRRVKA